MMENVSYTNWIIDNFSLYCDTDGYGNAVITTKEDSIKMIELLFDRLNIEYEIKKYYAGKKRKGDPEHFGFRFCLEDIRMPCKDLYSRLKEKEKNLQRKKMMQIGYSPYKGKNRRTKYEKWN